MQKHVHVWNMCLLQNIAANLAEWQRGSWQITLKLRGLQLISQDWCGWHERRCASYCHSWAVAMASANATFTLGLRIARYHFRAAFTRHTCWHGAAGSTRALRYTVSEEVRSLTGRWSFLSFKNTASKSTFTKCNSFTVPYAGRSITHTCGKEQTSSHNVTIRVRCSTTRHSSDHSCSRACVAAASSRSQGPWADTASGAVSRSACPKMSPAEHAGNVSVHLAFTLRRSACLKAAPAKHTGRVMFLFDSCSYA